LSYEGQADLFEKKENNFAVEKGYGLVIK